MEVRTDAATDELLADSPPPGEGLVGRVLEGREPEWIPDLEENYREHIKNKLLLDSATELTRRAVAWVLAQG